MDQPTVNCNPTPRQAIALQRRLASEVVPRLLRPWPAAPLVAAADISYDKHHDRLFAAASAT